MSETKTYPVHVRDKRHAEALAVEQYRLEFRRLGIVVDAWRRKTNEHWNIKVREFRGS